jgi:hypothetical protein
LLVGFSDITYREKLFSEECGNESNLTPLRRNAGALSISDTVCGGRKREWMFFKLLVRSFDNR